MKYELQRIISGKSQVRNGAVIQTTASYLKGSQRTSKLAKDSKLYKKQETEILRNYISKNKLIVLDVDIRNYAYWEKQIKSWKSRKEIEKLIAKGLSSVGSEQFFRND
jgi:hypothetical protein